MGVAEKLGIIGETGHEHLLFTNGVAPLANVPSSTVGAKWSAGAIYRRDSSQRRAQSVQKQRWGRWPPQVVRLSTCGLMG